VTPTLTSLVTRNGGFVDWLSVSRVVECLQTDDILRRWLWLHTAWWLPINR